MIILVQLAARMQPNLVQHAREIHHAAASFLSGFSDTSCMRRVIAVSRRFVQLRGYARLARAAVGQRQDPRLFSHRNRVNESGGFHQDAAGR